MTIVVEVPAKPLEQVEKQLNKLATCMKVHRAGARRRRSSANSRSIKVQTSPTTAPGDASSSEIFLGPRIVDVERR